MGEVVPATPVAVLCEAMRRDGPDDHASVRGRIRGVLGGLREVGAPLALGQALQGLGEQPDIHEAFDRALADDEEAERVWQLASQLLVRRRVLRRVFTPTGDGVEVVPGAEELVEYYANSIRHHLSRQVP